MGIGISPGTSNTLPSGVPNGYLKAVFFDKEGNVQAAESQVKFLQTSVSTWQTLEMTFTASQNGYLQVYVANESDQEVFFDDLEVAHTPTLIAQENHYYPYGMNMVGIEKQGMPHNRFQFNAQTERETAFHLHWDETPFRRYDAQIGRFHGVDALASEYAGITPYQYAFNNPVMFNDPSGLDPIELQNGSIVINWNEFEAGEAAGYGVTFENGQITSRSWIEGVEIHENGSGYWIDYAYKEGTVTSEGGGVKAQKSKFVEFRSPEITQEAYRALYGDQVNEAGLIGGNGFLQNQVIPFVLNNIENSSNPVLIYLAYQRLSYARRAYKLKPLWNPDDPNGIKRNNKRGIRKD